MVDRLYPGFVEVIESSDSTALAGLATTLAQNPSAESLEVLLWMLEFSPAWVEDLASLKITRTLAAVGTLRLDHIVQALAHGSARERGMAMSVLQSGRTLVSAADATKVEEILVSALSSPDEGIRVSAASTLHAMNSPTGNAALERALKGPSVSDLFFWHATRKQPPKIPAVVDATTFPTTTVAAVNSIYPGFLKTLEKLDDAEVRRLLAALDEHRRPEIAPVLVWMLANANVYAYGGPIVRQFTDGSPVVPLPVAHLVTALATARAAENRRMIARWLFELLRRRPSPFSPGDREIVVDALIVRLADPDREVRGWAADALGGSRAPRAARPLIASLEEDPDVPARPPSSVVRALVAIGSREALPALEKRARRSSISFEAREEAARAYIAIGKPRDPKGELRRLLWEQPTTSAEMEVMERGSAALPLAWKALESGSPEERRASSALVGSFPDRRSVAPILRALANSPGALTRRQLLFDLNMIALVEGTPVAADQADVLAAEHLRWMYEDLARQPASDFRAHVLSQKTILVFPDRVSPSFSVSLAAEAANESTSATHATAAVIRSPTAHAFREAVARDAYGVAFHAITEAEGVARVATTLYRPKQGTHGYIWISVYERKGANWVRLDTPPHVLRRMFNEPSLRPAFDRNYGHNHPLKRLRLDFAMEQVRVDFGARDMLKLRYLDDPEYAAPDASYVPLLAPYRTSDSPSVRYAAEFETGKLTERPNPDFWIDVLRREEDARFVQTAQEVLAEVSRRQFPRRPPEAAGQERTRLIAAALHPVALKAHLLPHLLPGAENIVSVQRANRLGLVRVRFGTAPLGSSGYSMLFEERDGRWVFLTVVEGWIS